MRKILFLLSLLIGVHSYSQDYKDTTFSVRNFTCQCKFNLNALDDNKIFDRSEKPAYYPGGEKDWEKFVKRNLDKKFKGKDKVEVRFEVEKNGDLSNFLLLNRSPNQKFEEVVRVIKLSGKWFPSVQNGFCVKSYVRLSFEL
jgi:hypothetical protein